MTLEINSNHFRGKSKPTLNQINSLCDKLRRKKLIGSNQTALETALLLRIVVSNAKFKTIDELLEIVKSVGQLLTNSQPKEITIGNVTRRVLRLIREEYHQALRAANLDISEPLLRTHKEFSTNDLYGVDKAIHPSQLGPQTPKTPLDSPLPLQNNVNVKQSENEIDIEDFNRKSTTVMIQAIQEVIDEIETVYEQVSKNAVSHIRARDVILTMGKSRTVEAFLKSAAQSSGSVLTIYVAESAPFYTGHEMAKSLANHSNIDVILIPDSAVFAIMSTVTKVVIGTHGVLANGSLIAQTGSYLISSVAEIHSTPVICVTGQFKLSPLKEINQDFSSIDFVNPAKLIGYDEDNLVDNVDIAVPYYEYVKPDLITVFITNDGEYAPFAIHRLVHEEMVDDEQEL